MSPNLALGIISITVGVVALGYRFLLPAPERTVSDPYAGAFGRSWTTVVSMGLVPMAAGVLFLAAWWQEAPVRPQIVQTPTNIYSRATMPVPAPPEANPTTAASDGVHAETAPR